MASVYVLLTPTGLSLQRVDTSGSALSTRVSGADGARLDQGYAVATDERGTDVLVVWYERTPKGTSLRVRRSRLGRILWSRHVEGPCAALDANGAVIPGGCAIGSTARAEMGR